MIPIHSRNWLAPTSPDWLNDVDCKISPDTCDSDWLWIRTRKGHRFCNLRLRFDPEVDCDCFSETDAWIKDSDWLANRIDSRGNWFMNQRIQLAGDTDSCTNGSDWLAENWRLNQRVWLTDGDWGFSQWLYLAETEAPNQGIWLTCWYLNQELWFTSGNWFLCWESDLQKLILEPANPDWLAETDSRIPTRLTDWRRLRLLTSDSDWLAETRSWTCDSDWLVETDAVPTVIG